MYLNDLVNEYFKEARMKYDELLEKPSHLKEILELGASKARKIAQEKMQKIYEKIGL